MFCHAGIPSPENLSVDSVLATTASLSWTMSAVMDQTPHSFLISYHSEGTEAKTISTDLCRTVISGLKPNTEYVVSVIAKAQQGEQSQASIMTIHTGKEMPLTRNHLKLSRNKANSLVDIQNTDKRSKDY